MHASPTGMALIARFEGFSAIPYRCPAGWWTIGYGHVIRAGEMFDTIEEMAARALLARDVSATEKAVVRLIHVALTQAQCDALMSFTFNLGAGALQRSTLRQKINRGAHEEVPRELMRWVWAGGRKLPGLARRRAAEGVLYAS